MHTYVYLFCNLFAVLIVIILIYAVSLSAGHQYDMMSIYICYEDLVSLYQGSVMLTCLFLAASSLDVVARHSSITPRLLIKILV